MKENYELKHISKNGSYIRDINFTRGVPKVLYVGGRIARFEDLVGTGTA